MRPRISTDPRHWRGALPEPAAPGAGILRAREPVTQYVDWFRCCIPSLNQHGDSCVGWGWAHWMSCMIRRHVDNRAFAGGWQLDAQEIWVGGRRMFWGGKLDGGIYLPQGLEAAIALGVIPPGTELLRVAADWDSVGLALLDTPLVQAHAVHLGWFRPDPESGCLDHEPTPTGADGYHCTLRVARLLQDALRYYALQNSWGADWGYAGFGAMTAAEDAEGIMSPGLYTAKLPAGWQAWDGWRKHLVRAP